MPGRSRSRSAAPDGGGAGHVDVVAAAALVVVAVMLRAPGIWPSSLWLDDAWASLVAKAAGIGDILLVGATAPGFAALLAGLLGLVGGVGSDGPSTTPGFEFIAQLLALTAGLIAPIALYWFAIRRGLSRAGALVGAGMLVASPVLIVYSTRVKHYTLDALLAVGLLWLTWRVIDEPGDRRRWMALTAAAVGATVISAGVAPVAGATFVAGLLAALGARAGVLAAVAAGGTYAAVAASWILLVILPGVGSGLHRYWANFYLETGDGLEVAAAETGRLLLGVLEGFAPLPVAATAVVLGICLVIAVLRRPAVTVAAALPVFVAIALAAAAVAPLGTGRTDAYLYPGLALIVAIAADGIARGRSGNRASVAVIVAGVLVGGLAVTSWFVVDPEYPEQDIRPLVLAVENQARVNDRIIVYPSAVWAFALYTTTPVELVPHPVEANGFRPSFGDPRITVLGRHRAEPDGYRPEIAAAVDGRDRVWLIASHISGDLSAIEAMLGDAGLHPTEQSTRPGAKLTLWER